MKIALCAIAKHENLYIRDWAEYHLNLGVSHIYIYDNNEPEYEPVSSKLSGLSKKITLFNVQRADNKGLQLKVYKDCYDKYHSEYDWFIFIDIDEFVYIKDKSLDDYLSQDKFKKTSIIHLNWRYYGDNDLLIYDDMPVWERFINPAPINVRYAQSFDENRYVKSIINCNYNIKSINNPHTFIMDGGLCSLNNGSISNMMLAVCDYNHDEAWVNHYGTKTIEEYLKRRSIKTRVGGCNEVVSLESRVKWFFNVNKWTPEKEMIIRKYGIKYKDI